jgi:hypothetical protein
MSVYRKLQAARAEFLSMPVKKSGKNKFAGFEYFELSDFIPTVSKLFDMAGLCGVVRFTDTEASLTVYDADGDGSIVFTSPLVMAENAKGQAIQSMGSTHTYFRRYLWLLAMDIVEVDLVDAAAPAEKVAQPAQVKDVQLVQPSKSPMKTVAQPEQIKDVQLVQQKITGKEGGFQMVIDAPTSENLEDWLKLVKDSTSFLLDMCESDADVMTIFKKNKVLFDTVKTKDPEFFKEMMGKFTETKNKFKE